MLSVDEVTTKIKEFQNMHRDKNYHFHNTYYMYTEDMNGNITGEAYGINFMTNYGFNRLCSSIYNYGVYGSSGNYTENPEYFNRLVGRPIFGTGTGPLTFNEPASVIPAMQELFSMPSYTVDIKAISTEYDSDKRVIYETDYMGCGVLDYNISGVTEDTNITEVGIGFDATHLYFHFLIRNKDGDISPIVKRPNEKLTIYVYNTFCVHEDVMLNALQRDEYVLTNPSAFFEAASFYDIAATTKHTCGIDTRAMMNDRNYCYQYDTYTSTSNADSSLTSNNRSLRSCISNNSIYTNNECEYDVRMTNSILLENREAYIGFTIYAGVRDDCYYTQNRNMPFNWNASDEADMFIIKFDKQPTTEEIICNDIFTNDLSTNHIDCQYGNRRDTSNKIGAISVVDYNIQSMKMFNVQDGDFTIEEDFSQNNSFQNFHLFNARCPFYEFTCPDGIKRTIYVSVNPWVDMKISKFTNIGITIFASDKAWDSTTWTQITNIADVPDELSHSRYYVSYSNVCLTYEFQDQYYPRITTKTNIIEYDDAYDHDMNNSSQTWDDSGHSGYIVGTDQYNWFALGKTIFMMNDDNTINSKYNLNMNQTTDMLNRFAYKNLYFITNGRNGVDTSLITLCQINNDHTVNEIKLPRAFDKSCMCYYSDTGISKNGRFIACWTDTSSGTLIYDMELLKDIRTETAELSNYSRDTNPDQILTDFVQGFILTNDGISIYSYNDYWISINKFIELPESIDKSNMSAWLNIVATGIQSLSYPDLWCRVYFYDEDETYLGYSYYQRNNETLTTIDNSIPYDHVKKIKLSIHQGWGGDMYVLHPDNLASLKVKCSISDLPQEGAITLIPNACHSFCMKNRNILVYTKEDEEYIKSWYIQDLEHMDVAPQKISIEEGQYGNTTTGGMGFSNYIYIRLNDQQNIYSTWMYDLENNTWSHLVDLNLDFTTGTICGDDKCILWTPNDHGKNKYIITSDEPTVWRTFSEAIWDTTIMKYINNGKQLVISSNYDRREIDAFNRDTGPRTYDLGLWLRDKKWVNGEPRSRYDSYFIGSSYSFRAYNYPYKNGIITLKPNTWSDTSFKLYYYPIEYYLPHKTVGTTKTITAYNNPIKITGKGYKFTRTNDMSKLGLDNN